MKKLPEDMNAVNLKEPLRCIIITNPRKFVYRIYYNQASSNNEGTLELVNWYDGNNLGLFSEPILSRVTNIYKDFHKRSFIVPVRHVSRKFASHRSLSQSISFSTVDIFPESSLDFHQLHRQQFHRRFYWSVPDVWKWIGRIVHGFRTRWFPAENSCGKNEF